MHQGASIYQRRPQTLMHSKLFSRAGLICGEMETRGVPRQPALWAAAPALDWAINFMIRAPTKTTDHDEVHGQING